MRRMIKGIALLGCICLLAGCARNETAHLNESEPQTQSQPEQTRKAYQRKATLAAGNSFSFAINEDGKILAAGERENMEGAFDSVKMPDTSSWENMVYIYASMEGYVVCGIDAEGKPHGDGMYGDAQEKNLPF